MTPMERHLRIVRREQRSLPVGTGTPFVGKAILLAVAVALAAALVASTLAGMAIDARLARLNQEAFVSYRGISQ